MSQTYLRGFTADEPSTPDASGFVERPYQRNARIAVESALGDMDAVIVEMATGLGKTEIFTQLMSRWEKGRCLVIAPQITLVAQAAHKIAQRTGVHPGIEQAHNWSDESTWSRSPFVVASKDTLVRGRYKRIKDVGLVVVDEAHLSITKSWANLLDHFMAQGAKVLGVTATAKRHDRKSMANLYEGCVYQYGIVDGIRDGWLVNAQARCIRLQSLNLSEVGMSSTTMGRDFSQIDLSEQLEKYETIYEIAEIAARETRGLKTAIYCASVAEAQMVSERLSDSYGIKSAWICADTNRCSPEQRHNALKSFTKDPDGVTHLCNVGILTTGWDFPGLQCIIMARPTRSKMLYTQIFGRGTRPLEGTVDFAGSTSESRCDAIANSSKPFFKMIDLVDVTLAHKIMTSPDVMGGTWGVDVVARAKENLAEKGEVVEIDEALRAAQKQLQLEREQKEREERARIAARAEYRSQSVDPFGNSPEGEVKTKSKRGARFPFGRFCGELVRDTPTWYLRGCMEGKPRIRAAWLWKSISKELESR